MTREAVAALGSGLGAGPRKQGSGRLFLWSALGVFSQLAFVRMDTTMVGGVGYYANVLLLVAMLANAAGFLADRLGRRVAAVPALLLVAFHAARLLGAYNMLEEVRAEFLWSKVANVYPRPANFDLQLALYLLCVALVPVMLLLGAAQGRAFVAARQGWSGYLVMGFGGIAGAAAFTAQNQLLSDPTTLFLLWGSGLAVAIGGTVSRKLYLFCALAPLLLLVPAAAEHGAPHIWSPYQRITLVDRGEEFHVLSNGFFINTVSKVPRSESNPALRSWYEVALQNVGRGDRVLILGSGCATSDVREAVHRGAGRVDAVEIEGEFVRLGLRIDPERTYQHPAVRTYTTDARRFLARTGETYDLVYFSFLDSQTLASSHVRFRLDSFLYTLDGLGLGWSRVSPKGTLLVNFFCGTPWLRQRMYDMIRAATGADVQVLLSREHPGGTLFATSGGPPLSLPAGGPYVDVSGEFRRSPPARDLPTDDWPFFYSRGREVPIEYVRFLVGVVFMLATVLLAADRLHADGGTGSAPASHGLLLYAAFSGAAFFFIELRTIAGVTPVFGSTHLGQSLVIMGIIGVSLVGSLAASRRSLPAGALWVLLLLSLGLADRAVAWFHPYRGTLAPSAPLFLVGLLAPAGVAGYLYLTYLKRLRGGAILAMQRANIAGSAVGGLAECTTVLWGFRRSLAVALVFYLIALACAEGAPLVERMRRARS